MANPLQKEYGPLPLWGWLVLGGATYWLYRQLWVKKPNADSAGSSYAPAVPDPSFGWLPNWSGDYPASTVLPTVSDDPVPTPGSQGGPMLPGIPPAVTPTFGSIANLLDPTTGRPIHSGPNGEGGYGWSLGQPIPPGQSVWQMPDGRWSSYYPGQMIQNGNRAALGLGTDPAYSSLAPGTNPVAVQSLLIPV